MVDYGYVDVGNLADFANNSIVGLDANDIIRFPRANVQPVKYTVNESEIAHCDKFICRECGIALQDWIKVNTEPDWDGYIDETRYEYEFKYCPECGAKVEDSDENE